MRQSRIKQLKKEFNAMYAYACEEAKAAGDIILPRQMAWRIFKKYYLRNGAR